METEIRTIDPFEKASRRANDKIASFYNRLKKIGIEITMVSNYPWLYLDTINGKKVTERFQAEHGFTIMFRPIKADQEVQFTDINEIFKLIRKYVNNGTKNI